MDFFWFFVQKYRDKDTAAYFHNSLNTKLKLYLQVIQEMKGHNDTITALSLSNCGSYVLSNAMDNTLRIWDVRPFVTKDRMVKMFMGHKHNFEMNLLKCAWSPDDTKISAGSADRLIS